MLRQLARNGSIKRLCVAAIDQSPFLASRAAAEPLTALPSLAAAYNLLKCLPARPYSAAPALAEDVITPLPPLPRTEHLEQGHLRDVEVPLFNINRNEIGKYVLSGDIFDVPIRTDILHRVVRWQLARRQQGTHKTKTRSEVRGGGAKPWQQKKTGKARAGTIRAPQWRGGGIVHGPVPRSHEHSLFKRVRRLGLKCALSAKAWERRLTVVDSLSPVDSKTKTMDGHVHALLQGAERRSALMVDSDKEGLDGGENLRLGAANLPWVDIIPAAGLNVYSILQRDHLVITKNALEMIVWRLRQPLKPCSLTP